MRLLHTAAKSRASFDDPNLVSQAGLVPAARLTENVGMEDLVAEHVPVAAKVGANPFSVKATGPDRPRGERPSAVRPAAIPQPLERQELQDLLHHDGPPDQLLWTLPAGSSPRPVNEPHRVLQPG